MEKALEQEKELVELKSRFVAMASHEFRTPLTSILSASELLERYSDRMAPDKRLNHLLKIKNAVKHMKSLLDDVLALGQVESENTQYTPKEIDVRALCLEIINTVTKSMDAHHRISIGMCPGFPKLCS